MNLLRLWLTVILFGSVLLFFVFLQLNRNVILSDPGAIQLGAFLGRRDHVVNETPSGHVDGQEQRKAIIHSTQVMPREHVDHSESLQTPDSDNSGYQDLTPGKHFEHLESSQILSPGNLNSIPGTHVENSEHNEIQDADNQDFNVGIHMDDTGSSEISKEVNTDLTPDVHLTHSEDIEVTDSDNSGTNGQINVDLIREISLQESSDPDQGNMESRPEVLTHSEDLDSDNSEADDQRSVDLLSGISLPDAESSDPDDVNMELTPGVHLTHSVDNEVTNNDKSGLKDQRNGDLLSGIQIQDADSNDLARDNVESTPEVHITHSEDYEVTDHSGTNHQSNVNIVPDLSLQYAHTTDLDQGNMESTQGMSNTSLDGISTSRTGVMHSGGSREITSQGTTNVTSMTLIQSLDSHTISDKNCSMKDDSLRCLVFPEIIIEPRLMCVVPHTYVVYVLSTIGPHNEYNSSVRDLIRRTWANQDEIRPYLPGVVTLRLMFVIGQPIRYTRNVMMISAWDDVVTKLQAENDVHNDVLLARFEDNYDMLTYKGVVALKWLRSRCPLNMLDYVAKVDEDVFLNTGQILRKLACKIRLDEKCHFSCMQIKKKKPQVTGKWRIGDVGYNDTYYPDYCSGHAYFICQDGFKLLLEGIDNYPLPYWRLEDVFLTGVLPKWTMETFQPDQELIYTRLHQYQYIRDVRNISDSWLVKRDFIHGLSMDLWTKTLQEQKERLRTSQSW